MRLRVLGPVTATLAVVALSILAAACGDDGAGAKPPASTPSSTVATAAVPIVKTPEAGGRITLIAHNLAFDADELRAPAGTLTLTIDNRDGGTPHNLHVFAGSDNAGASIGETTIENGPATSSVALELNTGTYFFQCDVHPSMHGSLIAG